MKLRVGTSGFSYKEWKGPFYPKNLPDALMLRHYAERLQAVEINNTFYRMPRSDVMRRWAEEVPDDFVFVIKASQRITHKARLKEVDEALGYLWGAVTKLEAHLGPLLFQLPPWFKKDAERLRTFLASLPDGCRAAMEFRHASWNDEEVLEILRAGGAAMCVADKEGDEDPPLPVTADWGYLRLRREGYGPDELRAWAERVRGQPWEEAFVFFKHEDAGAGPRLALEFAQLFASG